MGLTFLYREVSRVRHQLPIVPGGLIVLAPAPDGRYIDDGDDGRDRSPHGETLEIGREV